MVLSCVVIIRHVIVIGALIFALPAWTHRALSTLRSVHVLLAHVVMQLICWQGADGYTRVESRCLLHACVDVGDAQHLQPGCPACWGESCMHHIGQDNSVQSQAVARNYFERASPLCRRQRCVDGRAVVLVGWRCLACICTRCPHLLVCCMCCNCAGKQATLGKSTSRCTVSSNVHHADWLAYLLHRHCLQRRCHHASCTASLWPC